MQDKKAFFDDFDDDVIDDSDWDSLDFEDMDFGDDSEWDDFILEHEQPAPRRNTSIAPAAPPTAKEQVSLPERSVPFTGWEDSDSSNDSKSETPVGNGDLPMPSCGGCLIGLLFPPLGIYRVWKNENLSQKNKINATTFLCLWLCIMVLVSFLISNLSSDPDENSSYSSQKTTTTTSTTQSTKPTEPAASLPELLEIESPLGTTTCLVYDVLNGSKTEVIGQRGYIMMYKETLLNASDEDFVEFIKAVAAPGFNWVTINFGDGTGIVVRGGITEIIDYGSVIEDSGLDPIYGYAILRNGKYEYQPKE